METGPTRMSELLVGLPEVHVVGVGDWRHIHGIGHVYDPPLDEYAGAEFADASDAPDAARQWAARVLPVDPLEATIFLDQGYEIGAA